MQYMPSVRGDLRAMQPLAQMTRFGVGGPAEIFFVPADEQDLAFFMKSTQGIPVTVIGSGSNLLIRDGGIRGIVIKLGAAFQNISIKGNTVTVGAATMNFALAKAAMEAGLSGLEFLSGIPGNAGGSAKMNAGSFGSDVSSVLIKAKMIDNFGNLHELTKDDLIFNYRETTIPTGWIFTELTFQAHPKSKGEIAETMNNFKIKREESQPINVRTAGSTFKNPEGLLAWKLIEKAGCRGMRIGGAMVSEKHCNFLINTGNATAEDLENLGEEIKSRVYESSFINLRWEIRRMGVKKTDSNNQDF
jgi:UDP-N-acetylmuramate dehydrogenase